MAWMYLVVRSRPDIVAAERKLAVATAGQGVAMAERYPDISLSGFFFGIYPCQ